MDRSAIANRIEKLINSEDLSIKDFSEKIGVQRSSISHVLSGRNKPSLDFILNILRVYPDLNEKWLLYGKGKMMEKYVASAVQPEIVDQAKQTTPAEVDKPLSTGASSSHDLSDDTFVTNPQKEKDTDVTPPNDSKDTFVTLSEDKRKEQHNRLIPRQLEGNKKTIRQVMVFYEDGTFETYFPGQESE